ncbi:MAG: COX15/CtaA family protein [Acidobacteria bacterium]|nr:COX15/CtaA family protein [Acidobacteriota bacterium]
MASATFVLLLAGALVTSNDAGLAVPDWPLSYGSLMPPMVGNIVYEHGHRLVASFVGLLTIGLTLWLWRREPRAWVRKLGWVALAAVVAQGLLGGVTVLLLLPRPVSIAHASLAQLFFCLTVSLALVTSPRWQSPPVRAEDADSLWLGHLSAATTAAVFLQLVLGAAYRHSALGLVPHLAGAAVVAFLIAWCVRRVWQRHRQRAALCRPVFLLGAFLVIQLVLGALAYFARAASAQAPQPEPSMVVLTVAHVGVGALILATSVVLTLTCYRCLARPREAMQLGAAAQKAVG